MMKEETLTKMKNCLLTNKNPTSDLINKEITKVEAIQAGPVEQRRESYYQKFLSLPTYFVKCEDIISSFPVAEIRDEFLSRIKTYNYPLEKQEMNIGHRISFDDYAEHKFEEWANVLHEDDNTHIEMSLHKVFTNKKFEITLTTKFFSLHAEVTFDENFQKNTITSTNQDNMSVISTETTEQTVIAEEANTNIPQNSIRAVNEPVSAAEQIENERSICMQFVLSSNGTKNTFDVAKGKTNNEISSEMTYSNEGTKEYETSRETMIYNVKNTRSEENEIIVKKVDKESTKSNENTNYYENNYETYNIDPDTKTSYGKKRYKNNLNRKYIEDWHRVELDRGGFESKVHKFLDNGYGETTTEDIGKRMEGEELAYEYHETNINNIATGDELTTKIGRDRINEWNSTNKRNHKTNSNHVENKAKNYKEKLEWFEKWDEEGEEKSCFKWGKNEQEEWEESWKETYDKEKDDRVKNCYKKCKKLQEDKEWYETWTEKNNGKPNCEKTCYKMNREGNNKFENYWGNIIVNYIDNKRMNYVGFVTNNDKKEFIDYTYENTNN